jgi:hypothetical protein
MRAAIGVTDTSISNALARGVFPASWYRALLAECEGSPDACSLDLFSFRVGPGSIVEDERSVDDRLTGQSSPPSPIGVETNAA